jgi:hypothetical protein
LFLTTKSVKGFSICRQTKTVWEILKTGENEISFERVKTVQSALNKILFQARVGGALN